MFALAQSSADRTPLQGTVRDASGAAIAGAKLTLAGKGFRAEQTSAPDGSFHFDQPPARQVTITVTAQGFADWHQPWDPTTGSFRLEIILSPALVRQQVTITATRTETRVSDTAASIVVLSQPALAATAALTLDDVLRQAPGFTLFRRSGSRTANPTSQGASLRGIGASGASRALVLADGIPLNDPFGGWIYWGRVPRAALESVEVLRGAASDLYGSDVLGGVVNILTHQPQNSNFSLEMSYGNQNTPDAALSAVTRRGAWAASAAGEVFHTDGYVLVDEKQRGRVDTPASAEHKSADLRLEHDLPGHGRLFADGSIFAEARRNGTPLQRNHTRLWQATLGSDLGSAALGSLALRLYGGFERFHQRFSAITSNRNTETLVDLQQVPAQQLGFSGQWTRPAGTAQTLVAGVEARAIRGESDELIFSSGRARNASDAGARQHIVGLFLEDIVRLGPQWLLTAAARIDHWNNVRGFNRNRPVDPAAGVSFMPIPDRDETAVSPRLTLLRRLSSTVSVSASGYRAFRAPTLNELYRSFRVGNVLTLANANLKAERLAGGEAGASYSGKQVSLSGTFFWSEVTRPIANRTLSATPALITRLRQNLGRLRSRGLELNAQVRPSAAWNFSAGYQFADAVVTRFSADRALEGLEVPQVARHQFAVQGRYSSPRRLTFGLQGRASSRQFEDDQNQLALDPFFALDALVSHPIHRNLDLFVAVENIFNQRYQVGRTPVTTLGPPILARVGMKIHFGEPYGNENHRGRGRRRIN